MARSIKQPKINQKMVEGLGHLQPAPNPWIGVFNVNEDLLEGDPADWKLQVVRYEGPFDCRHECIDGSGEAEIIHVRCSETGKKVIVTIEGVGEPVLEKKLKRKIRFKYNSNLPIG